MYRVMIVDDEQLVLDSFAHVIESHSRDFELAGTCISGEDAINRMPVLKPHVVFMDVNMPGLNGIDAIRHISERYPETLFILATAYERFDIARQVIPLNVLGYLVKPVTRPRLLAELDRIVTILKKRVEPGPNAWDQQPGSTDRGFVSRLLSGMVEEDEWQRFARERSLGNGEVALALLEQGRESSRDWSDVCRKLEYKLQCHSLRIGTRLLVLIADSNENRNSDLEAFFSSACGTGLHCVLEDFMQYTEVPQGYRRMLNRLGHSDLHALTETGSLDIYVRSLVKTSRELKAQRFYEIWTEIFAHHDFPRARGMLIALLTLYIHRAGIGQRMIPGSELAPAAELSNLEDFAALEDWLKSAGGRLFSRYDRPSGDKLPATLRKAVGIIHEQHACDLQLSDIARSCGVSATHLSRLFSTNLGLGFVDYLNRYRVAMAAELLMENSLSIKEISAAVGFSDPNYFSRVFRRWRGVRPSAFVTEGA